MYCLRRTEHNPFYQSAEDLTDRGVPTWKQLQDYQEDNDGYEILRALSTSMGNENKALPLGKKDNGFRYCLSPTDSPACLRPVPSPRRVLLQNQSPRRRRETPTTEEEPGRGRHNRKRPSNLTPDLASALQTQQKESPIYELPDKFINTGRRRHHLEPPGHTPPPALPGRRNGGSVGGTASSEPQLPHLPPELALPCIVLAGNTDQKAPEGIPLYGDQRYEESGDETELQEVLQAGRADEIHREKTMTPDDVSALYANVKKVPKDGVASATGPKMRREESIDGETPPDVPPYRGGGEDFADGEPTTTTTTTTTGDDVEEKTQYALPLPPSLTDN